MSFSKFYQYLIIKRKILSHQNFPFEVRSPDGETYYFDIVAGVLQGDTLALYLFIISLDYVLRTAIDKLKENSFKPAKVRSRWYPVKTITDANYSDDTSKHTRPSWNPAT